MKPRSRFRGLTLFVTVGSTRFDKLIRKLLTDEIVDQLSELGFTKLILQVGKSDYDQSQVELLEKKIDIDIYNYKPNIKEDIEASDVVAGHAGAGTSLEVLRLNRRLLLVVNEDLMDNHQSELADELANNKFVIRTTVDNLSESLNVICDAKLNPFPERNSKFEEIFDEALRKVNSRL